MHSEDQIELKLNRNKHTQKILRVKLKVKINNIKLNS